VIKEYTESMDTSLLRTLTDIGLSEKEARVYLALLELGEGTVSAIAQKAELKRAIIYVILQKLNKLGYISRVGQAKIERFTAVDPLQLFNSEQSKITNFKYMLPLLRSAYNKPSYKPKFNYFQGKDAILTVYAEISTYPKSFFISSIDRLNTFVPEEVKRWEKGYTLETKNHQSMHLLTDTKADRSFATNIIKMNQLVRLLPKGMMMNMDFAIYSNKVAITSIGDPLFIVVIESQPLSDSMIAIFNILWQSRPVFSAK
jgi:HTH-type transcriptional regulator, sugar sensing transcriptional regulator